MTGDKKGEDAQILHLFTGIFVEIMKNVTPKSPVLDKQLPIF